MLTWLALRCPPFLFRACLLLLLLLKPWVPQSSLSESSTELSLMTALQLLSVTVALVVVVAGDVVA